MFKSENGSSVPYGNLKELTRSPFFGKAGVAPVYKFFEDIIIISFFGRTVVKG